MDPEQPRSPRRAILWFLLALVAALVLYPLSFGPVLYWCVRYPGPARPYYPLIAQLYAPGDRLTRATFLAKSYDAYCGWWFELGRTNSAGAKRRGAASQSKLVRRSGGLAIAGNASGSL
jgi:hypothetical protein